MATRTDRIKTIFEAEDKATPVQKKVGVGFEDVERKTGKFRDGLDKANGSLSGIVSRGFADGRRAADGFRDGLISGIGKVGEFTLKLGALATAAGLAGLGIIAKGAFDTAVGFEQTKTALTNMLQSGEKASALLKEIADFGAKTPFNVQELQGAAKSLLAFGFAQEEIVPSFKAIGDIAAAVGTNFNELALIYGKARTAGTLYAEDINQLTERGIPIIAEFAKQFGVFDESEIKKLAAEGKISFGDLQTAFTNMTGEGGQFFNLMEAQSGTVGGMMSNIGDLKDRIFLLIGGIDEGGNIIKGGLLDVIGQGLNKLLTWVSANQEKISAFFMGLSRVVGGLITTLGNLASVFINEVLPAILPVIEDGFTTLGNVITAVSDFVNNNAELVKALLIGLGVAIAVFLIPSFIAWAISAGAAAIATIAAMLPILLVIAAITLIVAAIYLLVTNFDVVKEAIGKILTGIFEGIKNIFNGIAGFIGGVIGGIRDFIVGVWEGIKNVVVGIVTGIKTGVENIFNGLKNAVMGIWNGITGGIRNILNGFIDIVNGFIRGVNDVLAGVDSVSSVVGINVDFRIGEIPKLQTGTNFFPGGMAIMNEVGPEVAYLPRGTRIRSFDGNGEEQVAGEGGGTTINNYNTFMERVDMNRVANKLAFQLDN